MQSVWELKFSPLAKLALYHLAVLNKNKPLIDLEKVVSEWSFCSVFVIELSKVKSHEFDSSVLTSNTLYDIGSLPKQNAN